jgi:hypothetical protein
MENIKYKFYWDFSINTYKPRQALTDTFDVYNINRTETKAKITDISIPLDENLTERRISEK